AGTVEAARRDAGRRRAGHARGTVHRAGTGLTMRRLMADIVWRKYRWIPPLVFVGLVPAWSMATDRPAAGWAFGYSMGMAFMVGPQMLNPSLLPRPIFYLPISKRDIWRATWFLATLGATLFMASAKALAMLIQGPGRSLSLSTLL